MQQNKSKWYQKKWVKVIAISYGALVGLFMLGTIIASLAGTLQDEATDNQGAGDTESKPAQQEKAVQYISPAWKLNDSKFVGTKYIVVSGKLTNTTGVTGIADCIVEFYDRENKWAGGKGLGGGREMKPGEEYQFTVQAEVEHVGLIARQNIHCGKE